MNNISCFRGKVVDNQVTKHPCLHTLLSHLTAAGFKECLNWKQKFIQKDVLQKKLNSD
jgi:hypothetical protein